MRTASLPMYVFPALAAAHQAFWAALRAAAAMPDLPAALDVPRPAVPDAIGPEVAFTQVCGFPLFRRFRGQGAMLGTPCYGLEGCDAATHRAAFLVRADDGAADLAAMRGRVFGCNSIDSNTGMNLPRLSLARLAGGAPFFSRVTWTGGHLASLRLLAEGAIDLCSVDCVTWGLARRHMPALAGAVRVLDWTAPSPCLPFVTAVATPAEDVTRLRRALRAVFADAALQPVFASLHLVGLSAPDEESYRVLDGYEREAADLGYPELC